MRAIVLSLLLALSIPACGGDSGSTPPPDTATYPGAEDPELSAHAETARADLATELGVPEEDLSIVLAEEVTWRNGALGCEEEGMSYTQALVDGYRIRIEHDGQPYDYHGEKGGEPVYCAEPSEPADGS